MSLGQTYVYVELFMDNFYHICILNVMLSHGHIPKSFLKATVVPIPKRNVIHLILVKCNMASSRIARL